MACKMNWDWVEKIQVIVYSTYRSHGFYTIKVMISEKNIPCNPLTAPNAKPWKLAKLQTVKVTDKLLILRVNTSRSLFVKMAILL